MPKQRTRMTVAVLLLRRNTVRADIENNSGMDKQRAAKRYAGQFGSVYLDRLGNRWGVTSGVFGEAERARLKARFGRLAASDVKVSEEPDALATWGLTPEDTEGR